MSKRAICKACFNAMYGVKTRLNVPHTCGKEIATVGERYYNNYEVEYTAVWTHTNPRKGFITQIRALDTESARKQFEEFYPFARIISINKKR